MNAPWYFAKLMDKVLGTARKDSIAFNFFYDICVYARTWDELMTRLEYISELLRKAHLTLKLEKCKFGMRRVESLGYILGNGEIKPGERKIKAIEMFPPPEDKHGLPRFFGLVNFFRRFVPNLARITKPN